jgi:class 3 adenylate cyclase
VSETHRIAALVRTQALDGALDEGRPRELLLADLREFQNLASHLSGQVIQRFEDGLLFSFPEVGHAVQFAITAQEWLVGDGAARRDGLLPPQRLAIDHGTYEPLGNAAMGRAVETVESILSQASTGDIVMTGAVFDLVEGSLWTPPELGGVHEMPNGDHVELFFLRAAAPTDLTTLRKVDETPPALNLSELKPGEPHVENPGPANFAAARRLIGDKPQRIDPATLKPKPKTLPLQPAPPASAGKTSSASPSGTPPVRFQRIRVDRAATHSPYARAYAAALLIARRVSLRINRQDARAGRIDIRKSFFGRSWPITFHRLGASIIVTAETPKGDLNAALFLAELCAAPIPADELDPSLADTLSSLQPPSL